MLRFRSIALNVTILALLGACAGGGGGGGGGNTIPVSPPPPPPAGSPRPSPIAVPPLPPAAAPGSFPGSSSQEYLNNWGPGGINAGSAWQFQNAHGEGVVIGVIDDGIDPSHPELLGRVDTVNSIDIVPGRNALTTTMSHGSELSALMVGNFNNAQTVGVAYQASVLAIRADNGANGFTDTDLANAITYATSKGVDVINLSLGSPSPTSAALRAAIQSATAAGVIIVVSAGNSGPNATQPNYPGFLATDAAVSNGLILVAGGSNPDKSFNTASNIAGSAANSYLVAPGWQIIVPDFGPVGAVPGFQACGASAGLAGDLCRIQGTSYASPHVAAAAAVLMSAFPGLTSQQVVQIILQSTDDMGGAGIDSTTGWGHLNLARAFQPIGIVAAPMSIAGVHINPIEPLGSVGPAFGDGLSRHTQAWTFAAFDSFGRTYTTDFSGNWLNDAVGPRANIEAPTLWRRIRASDGVAVDLALSNESIPESLRTGIEAEDARRDALVADVDVAEGVSLRFAMGGTHIGALGQAERDISFFNLVNADVSMAVTQQVLPGLAMSFVSASAGRDANGQRDHAEAVHAQLDFGPAQFDLQAGVLTEGEGALGFVLGDEFGRTPSGQTRFTSVSGGYDFDGPWRVSASATQGFPDAPSNWLAVRERLSALAFSIALEREVQLLRAQGVLALSVSQPLRIEGGELSFLAPVADRYGRASLRYEDRVISPTPSGREIRFGAAYRYFVSDRLSGFGEFQYVAEPGHVADREAEVAVSVGIRARR